MNAPLKYPSLWRLLGFAWLSVISVFSVIQIDQPLAFENADKWTHWAAWTLMMIWFGRPRTLPRVLADSA